MWFRRCLVSILLFVNGFAYGVPEARSNPNVLFRAGETNAFNTQDAAHVRVGIFQMPPLNFVDEDGRPQGLNVDLLQAIGRGHDWTVEYVPGSWAECLRRLQDEEIDLLFSVARTPDREQLLDYSHEPVAEVWGQVFVRSDAKIRSFEDLRTRTVGIMRDDINGSNFIATARQLGVACEVRAYDSHDEVFRATQALEVDAGVVPHIYGLRNAARFDLVPSTIQFSPVSIYFAVKQGRNHELLSHIDAHLILWRQDKHSYYYKRAARWLGAPQGQGVHETMFFSAIFAGVILLALVWIHILHRMVRTRTEELESALTTLRNFFDQPLNLNLIASFEGVMQQVSRGWLEVLGYTPSELVGVNFLELVHPDDREATIGEMSAMSEGAPTLYFENRYAHKNGGYRVLAWSAIPSVEDELIYAVAFDITEREEAKKKAEELFRLPQQNPNPVMRVSRDGVVLYANQAATDFRKECGCVQDGKVCPEAFALLERSLKEVQPIFAEQSSGNRVYQFCYSADPTREYINIYGMEITEQKRAEKELRLLSAAIQSAAEAVVITDPMGVIEYVNPAFERISGYSAAEAVGKTPSVLKSGRHDADFYAHLWQTIKAGDVWSGRFINQRRDGTLYMEEGTISSVKDASGKISHYVAVKRDITHELEVEEQYRQSQKLESVGQLAGGVAHDLNNLLTPVLGYSQILLDDEGLPNEFRMPIEQVLQAGARARDLVRQLLTFSRKSETEKVPLNLNEIIRGFERLIRKTVPENITLIFDLNEALPFISADHGQIEQVIMNLVVNARDAMPEGGVLNVRTQRVAIGERQRLSYGLTHAGNYVALSVCDNGAGMDAKTVEKIFEPFFTTKEVGKGTGLGLSTVFGIVKQHAGGIRVHSELGQGTSFEILFPASAAPQKQEVVVEQEGAAATTAQGEIWFVEDDEAVRDIVPIALQRRGYEVETFESPLVCLAFMETRKAGPDLLVTDVIMPEINGKELVGFVRERWPDCKVLYISGYSRDILSSEDLNQPAVSFLSKPFSSKELCATVGRILEQ